MQAGLNENISYGDHIIHVQTEDLGQAAGKVVSQLFLGGNVLVTKFIDYSTAQENAQLAELVTAIMQRQHQKLIDKLRAGKFDAKIAEHTNTAQMLDGPAPINLDKPVDSDKSDEPVPEESSPSEQASSELQQPSTSQSLADLPPPRTIIRKIHAEAKSQSPDPHERELQVIEDVVEHRSDRQLPGSHAESIEAAMHSLFDPKP